MVARGNSVHRVAEYFAGKDTWCLREDMDLLANTNQFTQRLAIEVAAYSSGLVDETAVEAVHRDVSREGERVTYRTFPYIAASLRLVQNLGEIERYGDAYREVLERHFDNVTAIARKDPTRACKNKSIRSMSRQDLYNIVYRCGRQQFINFGIFEDRMNVFMPKGKGKTLTSWSRLCVDHLRTVVRKNAFLSIADVEDHAIQDLKDVGGDAGRAIMLMEHGTTELNFFQILDADYKKKSLRLVKGSLRDKIKCMVHPVQVQRYEAFTGGGRGDDPSAHTERLVLPSGDPEILDLPTMAPWPVFRLALCMWTPTSSTFAGVLALRQPQRLGALVDQIGNSEASAIVLLEKLFHGGWTFAPHEDICPAIHDLDTPKVFWTNNPVTSKPYLRCLLALEDLIQSGRCSGLHSQRPVSYFTALLGPSSDAPPLAIEGQPVDLPPKRKRAGPQPLQARTKRRTLADSGVVNELEQALVGLRVPLAATPHEEPSSPLPLQDQAGALAQQQLPHPLQGNPPAEPYATAVVAVAMGPSSSSAPAAPPLPLAPHLAEEQAGEDAAEGPEYGPHMYVLPVQLEGQSVRLEKHDYIQAYRRISVKCPCRLHGAKCAKKRNVGPDQTKDLGALEPYAYLGAWLKKAALFDLASEHVRFKPSQSEVEAYFRENLC